ncbi:MAG: FAD-dependent oxidoreductase [candidate division NC10 bacterium]|nr:FAD-dependent oxidoreductase [candidate division NC10 bacterium]
MEYEVVIVGAGPAGIFTALELTRCRAASILILEKGAPLEARSHPSSSRTSGWGGAGAFSDGKLTLSPDVGGFLERYLPREEIQGLIDYVDRLYLDFGAPTEVHGGDTDEIRRLAREASRYDLRLIPTRIRHLGTDRCLEVLKNLRGHLEGKVEVRFGENVVEVLSEAGRAVGVRTAEGKEYRSRFVVLAPGREGSDWLSREVKRLGLSTGVNPVDIGVRVELPASILESITTISYEAKLVFHTKKFDDKVRTFCMSPYGEVVREYFDGVWTVNGHSYAHHRTNNTNFALLVSTTFTEPFKEPIAYGRYIARLANLLGGEVIIQRLGDLKQGRRSTPERIQKGVVEPTLKDATPGDLSFVLPYRYLSDVLEMLEALDHLAPGINSPHTLLYGVEVKFYSLQLNLSRGLEAEIENLLAVGDGAGVSRGLVQASVSGVIAAREIARRLN